MLAQALSSILITERSFGQVGVRTVAATSWRQPELDPYSMDHRDHWLDANRAFNLQEHFNATRSRASAYSPRLTSWLGTFGDLGWWDDQA